jgi:hypothetical protein
MSTNRMILHAAATMGIVLSLLAPAAAQPLILERGLMVADPPRAPATPTTPRPASPDSMRAAPLPGPGAGGAQQLPRVVIGAPGKCELATGGRSQPCISGLIYVQSQEGPVLLSVQSTAGSTIGFQGDRDSQVRPEHYTLILSRMHTSVDRRTAAKTVTGTCEVDMTADGRIWHRAVCRARDGNGLETVMTYTGDGRPVTTAHPGSEGLQAPVPGR